MDFQYLAQDVCLIQTAATGLRDDVRSSEHAFRAFAALIDTSQQPATQGILVVDEPPHANEISGQLYQMAAAHGLEFFAGNRGFLSLADRVSREAQPVVDNVPTVAAAQPLPL
jgi:hypothetical protein